METPFQPEDSYVEKLWNDLSDLEQCCPQLGATLLVNIRSAFAKAMILAAGNWLERRTQQALLFFARSASSNDALVYLVKNRVLYRQFHTLFDGIRARSTVSWGSSGRTSRRKSRPPTAMATYIVRLTTSWNSFPKGTAWLTTVGSTTKRNSRLPRCALSSTMRPVGSRGSARFSLTETSQPGILHPRQHLKMKKEQMVGARLSLEFVRELETHRKC